MDIVLSFALAAMLLGVVALVGYLASRRDRREPAPVVTDAEVVDMLREAKSKAGMAEALTHLARVEVSSGHHIEHSVLELDGDKMAADARRRVGELWRLPAFLAVLSLGLSSCAHVPKPISDAGKCVLEDVVKKAPGILAAVLSALLAPDSDAAMTQVEAGLPADALSLLPCAVQLVVGLFEHPITHHAEGGGLAADPARVVVKCGKAWLSKKAAKK